MMREVKNSKKMQCVSKKNNCCQQFFLKIETPKLINDEDGEINASDTDDQKNETQEYPFRANRN